MNVNKVRQLTREGEVGAIVAHRRENTSVTHGKRVIS